MNFFKLYIGDYQRDTAHLSVTEHGAYLLMLQHYYATERPLPTGKALHRMLRAQDKAEREAIDAIVERFWKETPDGLVNERADGEITKARAQADTNRQIAVAREAKRKDTRTPHERSTNRTTNDEPNHSHSHSVAKLPQERSPSGSRLPPDWSLPEDWRRWARETRPDLDVDEVAASFADFWHSKPGKDGRKLEWQATWRNWVRAEKSGPRPIATGDVFAGAR
jgi:uncharacterized protein YdaU (DUF1376 family)